ncbi:hypothetical protein HOA92_05030 [archaeon]|nr:hypothetical protein [archaeon]MBT6762381.1 hypothetical protein [archaeon]
MNMNLARLIPLGLCLYPHSISYDSTIIYQSKIKPYVQKDKIIPRSKNQTEIPKLPDNILEEDLQTHLINAREHYFDNTAYVDFPDYVDVLADYFELYAQNCAEGKKDYYLKADMMTDLYQRSSLPISDPMNLPICVPNKDVWTCVDSYASISSRVWGDDMAPICFEAIALEEEE